jgi:hypothetical protein
VNIFMVDSDPVIAAQSLCNRHVVKMILESSQLLCTAHHVLGTGVPSTDKVKFYKSTHKNHPCSIWTRKCQNNYVWLARHAKALAKEYTFRYGKRHKSEATIDYCSENIPLIEVHPSITTPALAMPPEYKIGDTVESYRAYYRYKAKTIDFRYSGRKIPSWIGEYK